MKNDNLFKLMLKMGLPTLIAQVINLLYSIVDRIYIGHLPEIGSVALTGMGLCSSLIMIISAFAAFVGNGGAPLASMALGRKDTKEATKILGNGITFLVIIGIVLVIIFYSVQDFYFNIVGGSLNTIPYAKEYLNIYLIGTMFVLFTLGLNNFITAQGKSVVAMMSVVIGAIANLVLDPILIFGFNLGVAGAAIATVISQALSCLWILYFLLSKRSILKLKIKDLVPDYKIMFGILGLGVAPFVMSITESLITFTMSGQLQTYGNDVYVGSLTVLQSVMQLVSTPISGFTQGVTSLMAFNYGAKNNKNVMLLFKYILAILFVFTFVFTLLTILFPAFFSGLFTSDKQLIEVTSSYMPIFMSGMLFFGIQRACQTTFVATKQALISLVIALLRKVILLVPLVYILPPFLGVKGIYMAEAISDATAAICCGMIFVIIFPKILRKNKITQDITGLNV